MINGNNTSPVQIVNNTTNISNSKVEPISINKQRRKSDSGDISNNKLGVSDKSTNKSLSSSNIKGDPKLNREIPKNNKLMRNKTVSLADSKKKVRVKFKRDFISTVEVESYKRFNVDMSNNESETNESTKCRCLIF